MVNAKQSIVYVGIGSNLGDRALMIKRAIAFLDELVDTRVLRQTALLETEPWGIVAQPCFLNCVVCLETTLVPLTLLSHLKRGEQLLGRRPSVRYGPRVIDMDILLYDQLCLDGPVLTIPHPRILERSFVVQQLVECAPDLVDPRSGLAYRTHLE